MKTAFPKRNLLGTVFIVLVLLQPNASAAKVSDFIGNSDDSCELPLLPAAVSTVQIDDSLAVLIQPINQSSQQSDSEDFSWLKGDGQVWWLGGGSIFGSLLVALTWQIRRSRHTDR